MAARLRKGDRVTVLCGRDRGVSGTILSVDPKLGKAIVEGVRMVVRHEKQSARSEGGRVRKPSPIELSNLALVEPESGRPSRVGFRFEDGRKVRYYKRGGRTVES